MEEISESSGPIFDPPSRDSRYPRISDAMMHGDWRWYRHHHHLNKAQVYKESLELKADTNLSPDELKKRLEILEYVMMITTLKEGVFWPTGDESSDDSDILPDTGDRAESATENDPGAEANEPAT